VGNGFLFVIILALWYNVGNIKTMEELDNKIVIHRPAFWKKSVSLWIAVILLAIGFGGGVLAGGNFAGGSFNGDAQSVIKGADAKTTSTPVSGQVTNTESLPTYLKKDVSFDLYWDTWNVIKNKYYNKEVPDTKLFYGSLQGLVASLGDPYSIFMTPTDATQFQDDLKGNFEGIGAEIAVKNNQLIIVSPLDDSPAMKAGLKPKDWILKINGTSTEGMTSNQAVTLIRGQKGTEVILNIYRDGFSEPKDFKIIRDQITVKSLRWEYKNDGRIVWIKVRQFNDDTMPLFDQAITEIATKNNVTGIILDLRSNPGGYLESAIEMAGEWDGDQVVVSEKNRDGLETFHRAFKAARLGKYKTVVLVNEGSASASEIVSGALKDWKKATLVGKKTFGKGSVQDLNDLKDGSQIKITVAKWFTPNGSTIDEQGIEPDVKVDLTEEDYNKDRDPQLDKALELLR
jgi:carboxyl-terminal processing protease